MDLADFLHANTYSGKLNGTLVVIEWAWSNMGMAFKVVENMLYLQNEQMNWADFLHAHKCQKS